MEEHNKRAEDGTEKFFTKKQLPVWISGATALLKMGFAVYDCVTYVPIKLFADPKETLKRSAKQKAKPIKNGDPAAPWRRLPIENDPFDEVEIFPGCNTLGEIWIESVRRYGSRKCCGTRKILSVENEHQSDGRIFKKMELGQYEWIRYKEMDKKVSDVAKGLTKSGQKEGDGVIIMSDTCIEWMIVALACFKCNFPVISVYATLGTDAVLHAINEVQATTIFLSAENFKNIEQILASCKSIKRVVRFTSQEPNSDNNIPLNMFNETVKIYHFKEILTIGDRYDVELKSIPKADDTAMIMYTSGTVGKPKGVIITNKNLISAVRGQSEAVCTRKEDVAIAYLPLAHILEVCVELAVFTKGCRLGYATPQTLLDNSPKLKKGQVGDCRALKPTFMICVPMILNRLNKAVFNSVSKSLLMQETFKLNYARKRKQWINGYPIAMKSIAFKKIREILGGRIRLIICGSAPLSTETELFTSVCFSCAILQGYGLTETAGGGTITDVADRSTGTVGVPLTCCEIMLREWKEARYSPQNQRPQGEILVSGPCVTPGYLNLPEKNAEDFVEIDGRRWFATGDIGEFREDGSLFIIDRKKDLVKLAHGEYVSLGKIESLIITSPDVDNICVCAGITQSYVVAIVVPNSKRLIEIARRIGNKETNIEILCKNEQVKGELLKGIQQFVKGKLIRVEIPQKIYLCSEQWTPASDLVTEALKLKRKNIESKFREAIDKMNEG